jgi:glycosyltransferase involved in cell wall biosynthesis
MKAKTHSPSGDVKKPILSIGMPIYNGARFVQEAIDSILEQDCDLELIISDNGSTDGTEKICRQYASKDGRIRYHRHDENRALHEL